MTNPETEPRRKVYHLTSGAVIAFSSLIVAESISVAEISTGLEIALFGSLFAIPCLGLTLLALNISDGGYFSMSEEERAEIMRSSSSTHWFTMIGTSLVEGFAAAMILLGVAWHVLGALGLAATGAGIASGLIFYFSISAGDGSAAA